MDFKIVDVFTQDGQLVVKAEHYHASGALWFVEHYTWQGREGLKQKRATNAMGELLLDDGTVAPVDVQPGPPERRVPRLPPGRTWRRLPGTHMGDDSILGVIRSIHRQRLASGWPTGLTHAENGMFFKPTTEDKQGMETLRVKFQNLIGRQE